MGIAVVGHCLPYTFMQENKCKNQAAVIYPNDQSSTPKHQWTGQGENNISAVIPKHPGSGSQAPRIKDWPPRHTTLPYHKMKTSIKQKR